MSFEVENLDQAASTPVDSKVLKTMIPYFCDRYYNDSAHYLSARKVKQVRSEALDNISKTSSLLCNPEDITFTSGGTESNNTVLKGFPRPQNTIISATEHSSITKTIEAVGCPFHVVSVNGNGIVEKEHLKELLRHTKSELVSIQAVNNETGAIQPLDEIYEICKSFGAFLHTDACQYWGKESRYLNADYITISGHKVYGPKGIGAIITRPNAYKLKPLIVGGEQQDLRAGTLATPLIVGIGEACKRFSENYIINELIKTYRNKIIDGLLGYKNIVMNSDKSCQGLFLNFSTSDVEASDVISLLERDFGFLTSRGSACMTGRLSKTVLAMGKSAKDAGNTIRISFGKNTNLARISSLHHMIQRCIAKAKNLEDGL